MLLTKKRIFIVEDNVENRAITMIILEREGAKTGFDRWGLDTVEKLKQFAPVDISLLDLMFPGNVTGFDVFGRIRAEPSLALVPVIALTASDPANMLHKVRSHGFAGFIRKPVDFEMFPRQVRAILDGQSIWER